MMSAALIPEAAAESAMFQRMTQSALLQRSCPVSGERMMSRLPEISSTGSTAISLMSTAEAFHILRLHTEDFREDPVTAMFTIHAARCFLTWRESRT